MTVEYDRERSARMPSRAPTGRLLAFPANNGGRALTLALDIAWEEIGQTPIFNSGGWITSGM